MTTYQLSIDAQICDHMVWELNQSGFQETLRAVHETDLASMSGPYGTVTRTYLPEYEHDFPTEYRVSIYPMSMTQARASRSQMQEEYQVMMALYRRIDVGDERKKVTLHGDRVMKLADQIRKWWESGTPNGTRFLDGSDDCHCARWMRCDRNPQFGLAEMSDRHLVFSPIVHTWMTIRTIPDCG